MVKHVLIVDDEPEHFANFSKALVQLCPEWELGFASNGEEALAHLSKTPCDAVIADMHMPEITGVELLNQIGNTYPKVVRLIASEVDAKELVMKRVLGSYDIVPKHCEPQVWKTAIHRALTLDQLIGNEELKRLVSRIRTFPSIPSLYFEVLKELRNPDASSQRVGEIIASDLAMSTKVLQALNSAYYALPRQITDPTEAVNILGFEMVKSLVLCIQVYSQFDKVKPYYFSIDKLWRHSTAVAQTARKIAYYEGVGDAMAEESYTTGLLHDVGKLVLVSNFGDEYKKAQNVARKGKVPLWIGEKSVFGASHGEVGAYLIGRWGMPLSMAEAVCYHHCPGRAQKAEPSPLTFVHVANALVGENQANEFAPPKVDEEYLTSVGLKGHMSEWRQLVVSSKLGKIRDKKRIRVSPASTLPAELPHDPELRRNLRFVKIPLKKLPRWAFFSALATVVAVGVLFFVRLLHH